MHSENDQKFALNARDCFVVDATPVHGEEYTNPDNHSQILFIMHRTTTNKSNPNPK